MSLVLDYAITTSSKQPKIDKADDAFTNLEDRWKQISSIKEWKVLALAADNTLICEISFCTKKKLLTKDDLDVMFEVVKEQHASRVIVTKNHPNQDLFPTNQEINLAVQIKEYAKEKNIEVIDQMIVKSGMYYSFEMNSRFSEK